jgi:hypothetical protein
MFSLNTKSGMLHNEDHGGGANSEDFDRADAADRFMHDSGKRMTFCKSCFPDNKNAMDDVTTPDTIPVDSPRMPAGSPTENTTARGTMPPRVTDPTADGRA